MIGYNLSDDEKRMLEIKRMLHRSMNGVVSESMKAKGADYRLNYGVAYPRLKEIASNYGKDKAFAEQLWASSVREMKILATMLYPPDTFEEATAEEWIDSFTQLEMVEQACFNLFSSLAYAPSLACRCVKSESKWRRITGLLLAYRLSLKNYSWINEEVKLLAEAVKPLLSATVPSIELRVAVQLLNVLFRNVQYRPLLENVLAGEGYDWLDEENGK